MPEGVWLVLLDCLVVWNMNFVFPFSWECHTPNWWTLIFFRWVGLNHQISMGFDLPKRSDFDQWFLYRLNKMSLRNEIFWVRILFSGFWWLINIDHWRQNRCVFSTCPDWCKYTYAHIYIYISYIYIYTYILSLYIHIQKAITPCKYPDIISTCSPRPASSGLATEFLAETSPKLGS